jgi:catechol 2,3-dioxygenase-like lactoylglutathione lyase family enzyme
MKIKQLILYTPHLEEQTDFYKKVLGFPIIEEHHNHSSFQVGSSVLSFHYRETSTPYHFAINIPNNQEKEAMNWLKQKGIDILRNEENEEMIDFKDWNARSMYFYDKDNNIVELIARKNQSSKSNAVFRAQSMLCISEIGVPVDKVEKAYNDLNQIKRLPIYSGDLGRFCAAGDENGLFIIIDKAKKKWYPTDDVAHSSYFRIEGDYNIEFANGKIKKV